MATVTTDESEDFQARARRLYADGANLGKERYTSREFFQLEKDKMWTRTWQMVCREAELRDVGDFYEHDLAGESILVIRDAPDRLRALSNVCRHRATHLKQGTGNTLELRCPFHGWKYGLSGELLEIPSDWDFPHLDRSQLCLPEFQVDTWQGYVFVNMDSDAAPLLDFLDPLPELFAPFHFENYFRMFSTRIIMPCNWKLSYAAFIESYHAPWTHPSTIATTNDVLSEYDLFGKHGRMIVRFGPSPYLKPQPSDEDTIDNVVQMQAMMGGGDIDVEAIKADVAAGTKTPREVMVELRRASAAARGSDISMMSESQIVDTWAYNVFPNFIAFTSFVGAGFYSRFLPYGDDPDMSTMDVCVMMPVPDGGDRPADAPCTEITADQIPEQFGAIGLGELFAQDVRNLQTVQQGLKSRFFPGINLALYQESLPRHMEEMLDDYLSRP